MGAENLPEALVASLAEQVDVHFAQGGQEAIGIVTAMLDASIDGDYSVIGNLRAGQGRTPDSIELVNGFRSAVRGLNKHASARRLMVRIVMVSALVGPRMS